MAEAAAPSVECPACHRRFVWKPELANKAVKCTCGKAFVIPSEPLAPPPPTPSISESDFDAPTVDAAAPPPPMNCPACNLQMKSGANICINCGYDIRKGGKIQTKVAGDEDERNSTTSASGTITAPPDFIAPNEKTPAATHGSRGRSKITEALANREDDLGSSKFLDLYLPIILIVLGIGVMFFTGQYLDESIGETAARTAIYIAFMVPMLLVALFTTARVWGTSYGPLSIGLLKLTALALGPMAVADLIVAIILVATLGIGFILAWVIRIIIVGPALAYMFDLDFDDVMITLGIILFLRFVSAWFIDLVLMAFQ